MSDWPLSASSHIHCNMLYMASRENRSGAFEVNSFKMFLFHVYTHYMIGMKT